jgi:hypothetical protein
MSRLELIFEFLPSQWIWQIVYTTSLQLFLTLQNKFSVSMYSVLNCITFLNGRVDKIHFIDVKYSISGEKYIKNQEEKVEY